LVVARMDTPGKLMADTPGNKVMVEALADNDIVDAHLSSG